MMFNLNVSHSQLAVFVARLPKPFNDWTQRHVNQGFAWRPGSVSFGTLVEAGPHFIELTFDPYDSNLSDDAVRVIEVPFEVHADSEIEVASISDGASAVLPSGVYSLRFEYLKPTEKSDPQIRLRFMKNAQPTFGVLRADQELNLDGPLLCTASPAE